MAGHSSRPVRARSAPWRLIGPLALVTLVMAAVIHTATSAIGRPVQGWPTAIQNPAGTYSWDGRTCARQFSCIMGFMHNGYASGGAAGDVAIGIRAVSKVPHPDEGLRVVRFAGHRALHRWIDARTEEWTVRIQRTTLAIRLEARPGTSDVDLAEAHTIIKSMRTERRDTKLGFRLVFTLATDDWDSG